MPDVTLSTKDDNIFLEQLKSGVKRTIKWNKYRLEMTNQTKPNHLNHLIDPTFIKLNRLSILSFENEEDEEEAHEKIMSIRKNDDYTTGNLLDYEYF